MKRFLLIVFILLSGHTCFASSKHRHAYGKHTIGAFAVANNAGFGVGLRYEQFLNDYGNLSLSLPFEMCSIPQSGLNGLVYSHMYLVNPGLRFYPTGSDGVVRFSTGIGMILGVGKGPSGRYTNSKDDLTSRNIGGIMLCNALTFHFSPVFQAFIGLDFGLGSDTDYQDQGSGILQVSVGLGYRF